MIGVFLRACICSTNIPCAARFTSSSSGDYGVENCLYSQIIQSSDNGGAINVIASTANLSISSTFFYECMATGSTCCGGAFIAEISSLSLRSVCGSMCCAAYVGQFEYSGTSTLQSDMISYSQCATGTSYTTTVTFFSGGVQTIKYINSTQNKNGGQCAGFYSNSVQSCVASFANVANCSSSEICVAFTLVTSGVFEYSNVFGNTFTSATNGIIFSNQANAVIDSCVARENSGGSLFHLFTSSGSLIVKNCIISHSGTLFSNGAQSVNCSVGTGSLIVFTTAEIQTSGLLCIFPCETEATGKYTSSLNKSWSATMIIISEVLLILVS